MAARALTGDATVMLSGVVILALLGVYLPVLDVDQ